jgi:hypothetical protein
VTFSVTNISQQELYLEVYTEKHQSGSWTDEDYAYDLTRDISKRYEKLVLKNPDTLKPGNSRQVTYHRCEKPTFVKQSKKRYEKTIIQRDSKSGPSQQRFRVQVYILDQGHVKFLKNVFSEPFKRLAHRNLAGSPAQ